MMKHKVVLSVLTTLLAAVAVFDIAEGILVLTGVCLPDVKFQGTPFTDATVPMLLLAIVVGGSSLLAAATVFIRQAWSVFLAAAAGLLMIAWEFTELVVVHQSSVLQSIFMYIGLLVIALAAYLWTTEFRGQQLKHNVIRIALLVIEALIGVSCLQGGIGILQGTNPWLQVAWLAGTPFSDYTIPGLLLVIVVGGSALLAAATVFIDGEWAVLVSALSGLLMAGYEVVEAILIDSKVGSDLLPSALVTQLVFFVPGLAVFGLAAFLWMRDYRRQPFHLSHAGHA
jgi:hypothetical protein